MADYITHERKLYIPPSNYRITTGTWTLTSVSGIMYQLKTAGAETSVISIPIPASYLGGEFGLKLKAIDVPLRITTADLSSAIVGSLFLVNDFKAVTGAGTNIDTTAVTITETGAAVTAAATDRLYTATISTQSFFVTSTVVEGHYQLDLSLVCPATTVVRAYGAHAIYDDLG